MDKNKAEQFKIETVSKNEYSNAQKRVLMGIEWFNLNNSPYGGYYNIQNQVGKGNTNALINIGYIPMHKEKEYDKNIIEIDKMQCSIGVKQKGNNYDVIIAFQGTSG